MTRTASAKLTARAPNKEKAMFRATLAAGLLTALAVPAFSQTVSIETATGPAELTAAPETVAVFDIAAADTLSALGVPVAGMPAPNYLDYMAPTFDGAEKIGTLFEPDFEVLAAMAPDLIVAGGRSSAQVEALSQVAPTIDMTIEAGSIVSEARARLDAYGTLFGKQAEAADLNAALDAKIAEARAAVSGKGTALVLLTNGGKLSAYGAESRFGWLHTTLGLPEAVHDLGAKPHGEAVSFEFIAEADPDWLLVIDRGAAIGQAGEAAAATLDNPLVAGTKAAQSGHILYLSPGPLYIAGGGVQSMIGTLDEIAAGFSGNS